MLLNEAKIIRSWIDRLDMRPGSVCLNLGSSTEEFRTVQQPFIDAEIIKPLENKGCRVIHSDLKSCPGVDEVGDVLDAAFQRRLAAYEPGLIICSNMLEHLTDPASFLAGCAKIVPPGGHLLISVPRSFPYHPDPIDTMFRPSHLELQTMLPDWDVVESDSISAGNLWDELRDTGAPIAALVRLGVRALLPIYRPTKWYPAAHRLLWLFRDYRVSLVLLRKPQALGNKDHS